MEKIIQITPLKSNFQRIIDFDRLIPSTKIVVFIAKSDTEKKTKNYDFIEKSLRKLREYCELTQIQFNMQVIDCANKDNLLDVILDFTRALIIDYEPGFSYKLNLGDTSLLMNIALIQAAQLVSSISGANFTLFVQEEIKDNLKIFDQKIISSLESLVTEPVSLELLDGIEQGKNLEELKDILELSLGSVSNYIKQLKELGLIEVHGHSRSLTQLGSIVKSILLLVKKI